MHGKESPSPGTWLLGPLIGLAAVVNWASQL